MRPPSEARAAATAGDQPIPIWCGLTLRNWRALRCLEPTIERKFWKRWAAVSICSLLNSGLGLLESLVARRRIDRARLPQPPVFILGHWRSGTTLLHELLAGDEQFTAPNLYQCSFPSHFLLTERWLAPLTARWQPRMRPMDAMRNGWDAPAEEELALLLTLRSPYLVSAFPDAPDRVQPLESLTKGLSAAELDDWKRCYRRFLQKLTLKSARRLVLKSPANTSRVPLLLELFPDAQFIHIVRNPYDVFSSTMHLHRVLSRGNSFTSQPPADLEERVLTGYLAMYQSYHLYRVKIPAGRRYELRFEDLERDPVGELERLYAHFDWPGRDQIAERLAPLLQQHRSFEKNRFNLTDDQRRRVAERWEPAFLRYGYPVEGQPSAPNEPDRAPASNPRSRPE